MGEVYRARDLKLKREVAIKILPDEFSRDADRISRFQREAEVLASLNHPNIAAIYDLQEANGSRFLVLELVEGETLAERIKRGPIPVDESLNIAKNICEALEAAHEKGVVHRDLKPANVKITPDGKVKVLDFGLAKAFEPEASKANLSQSPTLSMAATNAGAILGTAAYMSPEQAKGRTVDKRSDIFAFGCVLYEMLTSCAAFDGDDVQDILGAILKSEPDWTGLPRETPPGVRKLLRRCLEKNVKNRRSDAADVRIDIEEALAELATPETPPARGARLAWIASLAVAVVLIVALTVPTVRHLRETPPLPPSEMRVEIVTLATADPISFALSPDGRQIVFVASGGGVSRLWLRFLVSTTAQPLAGTESAAYPFWSPDSRSVGFFADGKLKRFDIGGGTPQTLTTVTGPRGGTWNADGVILFTTTTASPLFRVPASGGQAVPVTKLDRQSSHRFPFFLPDGRQFLFLAQGTPETGGIYLGSLDSAEPRRLTAADTAGIYLPSGMAGWLLWVRAGTLVVQRLDLERKVLTGDPVTLADPVAFDPATLASAVSVSAAGLVAYRAGGANRRQLYWFDRSGKALSPIGAPDENALSAPRVSPDGRRVAVWRTVQGNADIFLLDGTRMSRFTFDPASDRYPIWSPDGSRIVFDSNRKGQRDLYQKLSSGVGAEELLVESPQDKTPSDWSAAGQFILYQSNDPQTARDLWVRPMSVANASPAGRSQQETEGDRKPWVFLKTSFDESFGQFSPDGRWVAYMSNESERNEIYLRPFAKPTVVGAPANPAARQWPISTAGGIHPRWRPDGKELYYIGPNGEMMAAPIAVTGTTLEPGTPVALFPTRIYGGGVNNIQGRQYDVTRDGRFLINTVLDDASSPITLLLNWKPPAK
jgi:Tol biopolymer transport system component